VNAAIAGQTITVDAGVYSELVTVTKALTIKGPRAGVDGRSNLRSDRAQEAIVNGNLNASGTRGSSFFLNADNIVLDGFTVEGQNTDNTYGAGIHMGPKRTGIKIYNNIVQNNATWHRPRQLRRRQSHRHPLQPLPHQQPARPAHRPRDLQQRRDLRRAAHRRGHRRERLHQELRLRSELRRPTRDRAWNRRARRRPTSPSATTSSTTTARAR
jgi:hypothetical protein